jgi:ribosomal 30S subunit maturation factor RimM
MSFSWIEIGAVCSMNPARREVRLRPRPGQSRHFDGMQWLWLVLADGEELRCKVQSAETAGDEIRVFLGPGVTRDTVARMKGAVAVAEDDGSVRGGYKVAAWVGYEVFDAAGVPLGRIADAFETPAHGVIEVEKPGGGTFSLPVIEQVIAKVDSDRGTVTVHDITPYAVDDETGHPVGESNED